jgi:hypothetical protein
MTTAVQVQSRRDTQANIAAFTGAAGEVVVDTTNNRVVVNDGTTVGGHPLARLNEIAGGALNKFRNAAMDIWQRGTSSITVAVSGSGSYTADGWIVVPSGASVAVARAGGRLLTAYSLQITGASSVSAVILKQRIESYIAAALTSQIVTVQAQVYNNTAATITPALTVRHAGSADNWSSPATDVNAVSLQACPNGAWTQVAYTFSASASAAYGLEIGFDFGNNFGTSGKSVQVAELDIRATPGVPTGLNGAPPAPELRPIFAESPFNKRYYQTSYGNDVAPGSASQHGGGMVLITPNTSTGVGFGLCFPVEMRAAPAMSYWDGAGNANKTSQYASGTWSDSFDGVTALSSSPTGAFVTDNATAGQPRFFHYAASAEL